MWLYSIPVYISSWEKHYEEYLSIQIVQLSDLYTGSTNIYFVLYLDILVWKLTFSSNESVYNYIKMSSIVHPVTQLWRLNKVGMRKSNTVAKIMFVSNIFYINFSWIKKIIYFTLI